MELKSLKKKLAAGLAVLIALNAVPFNSLSETFDNLFVKADAYEDDFSGAITIYFTDSLYWGNPNVYYWENGSSSLEWPGKAMTFSQVNDWGQDVYSVTVPYDVDGIIFNGNGNQTVDITYGIEAGMMWYPTGERDGNHFVVGSSLLDPDAPQPSTDSSYPDSSYPDSSSPDSSSPDFSDVDSDPSEPTGESAFYVVGSFNEWQTDEAYVMTKIAEAEGEYCLSGVSLNKNDEFKIVETNGSIQGFEPVWYPAGFDNDYIVASDGVYDIYFRPSYDGGDDWYYNCIYAADVTPESEQYSVTINENIVNGTVKTAKQSYYPEEEVKLDVAPDKGYELDSITVNGGDVKVTENQDGTYSFIMPDKDVTVSATFAEAKTTCFNYTLNDSYGDSWNGAQLYVYEMKDDGDFSQFISLSCGLSSDSGSFELDNSKTYQFVWQKGEYDNECSFVITDDKNNKILDVSDCQSLENDQVLTTLYPIKIESTKNGKIIVDRKLAANGNTIKITANPNDGYATDFIQVNGGLVDVTKENNSTYTFTMPDGTVFVDSRFSKDISAAEITLSESSFVYDGEAKYVEYTVTCGGQELIEGCDFVFEGDLSAAEPGVYIIKLKGINAYAGINQTTWQIAPPDVVVTINGEDIEEEYGYNKPLRVTAPEAPEGYVFSHWEANKKPVSYNEIYSFIVKESVDLVPVYVPDDSQVEKQAVLNLKASQGKYSGKNAIQYTFTHSIPAGYSVKEVGLLYATNKMVGADTSKSGYAVADLTDAENATTFGVADVEDVVKNNTTGKVKKYVADYRKLNGTVSFSYAIGNNTDCYVYAVGYVKVKKDGVEKIIYTDLLSTSYNSIT